MPSVFISYRRKENSADARALYERLCREFGEAEVFIDLDGIEYGADFVETLERQLSDCKVLLALIGPDWLGVKNQRGERRIDDENDFVRIEVASGLRRGVRIVPVLIDGAALPRTAELPAELHGLVRRQAMQLDYGRFNADVRRLCETLKPILAAPPAGRPA